MSATKTVITLGPNGKLASIDFDGPNGRRTKLPNDGCAAICDGHTKNPNPVQMEYHEGTCVLIGGKWYCYP